MIGVFPTHDELGKRLILVLKGLPCSWDKCTFCPFFLEQGSLPQVLKVNSKLIEQAIKILSREDYERITIFNGGSFYELPVNTVIKLSKITNSRVVDIETRPEFIDYDVIIKTLEILKPKRLVIRIGFEVIDDEVRNKILNKGISQQEVYRIASLRKKLRKDKLPVEIISYVLFGMKCISEELVKRSVQEFNELFDGVIAIRYRKYLTHHPEEVEISKDLIEFLKKNTLLIDWSEQEFWEVAER